MSLETEIENAIIKHPNKFGFSKAWAIRNFRIAELAGAVDVVLIPRNGPFRIVLIETKVSTAKDAASKVVGQLLMYYGGALKFGLEGLEILRKFAQGFVDDACCIERTSPRKVVLRVLGIKGKNVQAFERLSKGRCLKPKEISLWIALNGPPNRFLIPLLKTLRNCHRLNIGLILVQKGTIKVLVRPFESTSKHQKSRKQKAGRSRSRT